MRDDIPKFRVIEGAGVDLTPGDEDLVGMYDTRDPEAGWWITNRGMDKIRHWAEIVPEVIFFHFSISQDV